MSCSRMVLLLRFYFLITDFRFSIFLVDFGWFKWVVANDVFDISSLEPVSLEFSNLTSLFLALFFEVIILVWLCGCTMCQIVVGIEPLLHLSFSYFCFSGKLTV